MTRQGVATKTVDLSSMVLAGVVAYYLFGRTLPSVTVGLLVVAVLTVWASFLMPTRCDYHPPRDTPCARRVRGKLRGCPVHERLKRGAVFDAIKLRNPESLSWVAWSSPGNTVTGSTLPTNPEAGVFRAPLPSKQVMYAVGLLLCTMISSIAAVVALFN
jgi:hypothetical protein